MLATWVGFEMRLEWLVVGVVFGMMVFRARVAVKERAREGFVSFAMVGANVGGYLRWRFVIWSCVLEVPFRERICGWWWCCVGCGDFDDYGCGSFVTLLASS